MSRRGAGSWLAATLLAPLMTVTEAGARDCSSELRAARTMLAEDELGYARAALGAMRGVTVGPIESALHPDKGYGSAAFERTVAEAASMGATWLSLTPFGRIADLSPTGVAQTFEAPFEENKRAVARAVRAAHARGMCVLLVPHLWVESGGWRGEIELGSDEAWARWSVGYTHFVRAWAEVARDSGVDMLAAGVELRSWLTTTRAPSFNDVLTEIRRVYPGLVTYAGNWDDVEETTILGSLDVIGINGFYPLAEKDGAGPAELARGGQLVRERIARLAERWHKPVIFTEFGYTTRKDPAVRPWEWPDFMAAVNVDQQAQADAYRALLTPLLDEPRFAGAFVWRLYADPDDQSQEAEWGFSPRGKLAELVLRDAFAAYWAADGPRSPGSPLFRHAAERVGIY